MTLTSEQISGSVPLNDEVGQGFSQKSNEPSYERHDLHGQINPTTPPSLPASYYDDFLSDIAINRKPSPIRDLLPLENIPGMISLLAGKPSPDVFPFESIEITARSPDWEPVKLTLSGGELQEGLQYGSPPGLPPLCEWFRGLQEYAHGRKATDDWGLTVGMGSQDLLYKAVTALVNQGDSVLVESPVYAGVIPMFRSMGCEQIEVETDTEGISSNALKSILENWPVGKPKPRVLYTVPYGCNPTGMTASVQRRREVLRLAREHNFIILEDDPYYYLYFGSAARPPSYFSLEREAPEMGRVLRFDSLSKVISAGIRIGFASGPKPLLRAIDQHTATSNLQTASLTQSIVWKILDSWGYEGFSKHTERVSAFYRERRDVFERAMQTHLYGLAQWTRPEAGLFFWFELLLDHKPNALASDSEVIIRQNALESGVLALPGTTFLPSGRKSSYVRASFSLNSEEEIFEALRRLRGVILRARMTESAT